MKKRRLVEFATVVVGVFSFFAAGTARAFDAQLFSPAVDPEGYFSVYSSRTAPTGRFHVALWFDYAGDPITSSRYNDAFPSQLPAGEHLVDAVHTLNLTASYSILDWLEIGLDAPFSDLKSDFPGTRSDTGPDSIRLLAKAQLLKERLNGFGFGLIPFVDLPSGNSRRLTSDGETDFGGIGVADWFCTRTGRFRASLNGGYKANQEGDFQLPGINDGSDEILFGLGLGVLAIKGQPILFDTFNNVEVIAELYGSTDPEDPFADEFSTPLEGLAGTRFYNPSGFYVTLGIGKSATRNINGAAVRVLASVGYTPPAPPPPPPAEPPPPTPPQSKVVVTEEQIVTLQPIYFDFDKATVKPVSYPVLDQVAQVMKDRPAISVRVEGHTDSFGSDAYNQKLSERRAQAVVKH
ncbi:MAG: OmpA family protein, partial [Candidatus Binatia bacterium]